MQSMLAHELVQNSLNSQDCNSRSVIGESLDGCVALELAGLQAWWKNWLVQNQHPNAFSCSPEYFEMLQQGGCLDTNVAVVFDDNGAICALAPLCRRKYQVKFDVASKVLFSRTISITEVLGSQPLIVEHCDEAVYRELVQAIQAAWPDSSGIYCDALGSESQWAPFLRSGVLLGEHTPIVYSPYGTRQWHMVKTAESFEQYMLAQSRRARQARRREVRKLEKNGEITFLCSDSELTVEQFLQAAAKITVGSWQHKTFGAGVTNDDGTREQFHLAIKNHKFRSYCLYCADTPIAYCVGFQAYGSYQTWEMGFDQAYADLSPGTVLIFKMMEDLHQRDKPAVINFGVGDSTYKRRFSNWSGIDETLMILKPSAGNILLVRSHRIFLSFIELAKKLIGRKPKD